MADRPKFLIDTDCGIDDAHAIIMALEQDVDIVGITCVSGNCGVDQVCINVLKVLEVCRRTEIPVYKGASVSLVGNVLTASHFHGEDGLGDVPHLPLPDMSLLKSKHAVDAMIDIVDSAPGEVTLVALAPLTNIALALRMDPKFSTKLKKVIIMGGNMRGLGNSTVSAEFNFACDIESAHVVLHELKCPMSIITWETCLDNPLAWTFFLNYLDQDTVRSKFLKEISKITVDFYMSSLKGYGDEYTSCDPLAMAVALRPECVQKSQNVYAAVELSGQMTRGQVVVDWGGRIKKTPNVQVIQKINIEIFKELLLTAIH